MEKSDETKSYTRKSRPKNRGWVYYGGLWPYIGGIRRLWWRNAGNFLAMNGKYDKTYHLRCIVCRSGGYACIRVFL